VAEDKVSDKSLVQKVHKFLLEFSKYAQESENKKEAEELLLREMNEVHERMVATTTRLVRGYDNKLTREELVAP
jgi:hypothetical protein